MNDKQLRKALVRLAHQKPELRAHLLPLLAKTAERSFPLVKPIRRDEEDGPKNYHRQIVHLFDLLEAASTQASHVEQQARFLATDFPEGLRAQDPYRSVDEPSAAEWKKMSDFWLNLGEEIYAIQKRVQHHF